jgi:hypothetical protein
VLKAEGIEFPENIKLNITEAKEDELNLTLPLKPEDMTGSVDELGERIQAFGCGFIVSSRIWALACCYA